MIHVLPGQNFESYPEFVTALNKARLANRKQWIVYSGRVCGLIVEIKSYDTGYLQILRIEGLNYSAPMDMKPTAWKETIGEAIQRAHKRAFPEQFKQEAF